MVNTTLQYNDDRLRKIKILIADDHPLMRHALKDILEKQEDFHVVAEADDGEEAVRLTCEMVPDVIIMDILMPKLNGLEATRILKNDPATKNCKIIMLTAKGQQTEREKGIEAGADDYFVKPFSPLELIRKVEEFLG